MEVAVLCFFLLLLFLILLYSLVQLDLLIKYGRGKRIKPLIPEISLSNSSEVPFVTVQLPIFNEKPVVERLLRNICQLEYPKERWEVQVLDDSTDDSGELVQKVISELRNSGIFIRHLRRSHRKGFKAGALKEGLFCARGQFVAIFDSDFLPASDWLLKTVPHFQEADVGAVQTRWGHLNRNYSLLTRLQAFLLDFHFILEQNGRSSGNHLINFNGTAGIWRKECIIAAGNWAGDTLTEDLDLSYRAQMKGWKICYLDSIETPAELPVTLSAARSQQFRWNKGAAQNFQKNFCHLRKHPSLQMGDKIHGFFHLLNSTMFPLILLVSIFSVPVLFILSDPKYQVVTFLLNIFSLSTISFFLLYWTSFSRIHGRGLVNLLTFSGTFFLFFSIALGFALHNSRAVLEGHLGKSSSFVRTPKFNLALNNKTRPTSPFTFSLQWFLELLLTSVFAFAVVMAFHLEAYHFLLFHLMLLFGYGYVTFGSINLIAMWTTRRKISPTQKS